VSITVVGSVAFDAVKTPFGERKRMLGGAATYFALAASFFDQVHVVGRVGEDFGDEDLAVVALRETDVDNIERVPGGKSFFWAGEYGWDLNSRDTLDTQLGVFEDFQPQLSDASRSCDALFLANIQPELQLSVLEQCGRPRFVAMDSMNFWIESAREALVDVISRVDCVVLNDAELRQLTERPSIVGYIARHLDGPVSEPLLRQAMAYGTALASFSVEEFGTERVERLTAGEIDARVEDLRRITQFEHVPVPLETS
jgi:sugar/nucleoside kinase (ribokinase family)